MNIDGLVYRRFAHKEPGWENVVVDDLQPPSAPSAAGMCPHYFTHTHSHHHHTTTFAYSRVHSSNRFEALVAIRVTAFKETARDLCIPWLSRLDASAHRRTRMNSHAPTLRTSRTTTSRLKTSRLKTSRLRISRTRNRSRGTRMLSAKRMRGRSRRGLSRKSEMRMLSAKRQRGSSSKS